MFGLSRLVGVNSLQAIEHPPGAMMFLLVADIFHYPGQILAAKTDNPIPGLPFQYAIRTPGTVIDVMR